MAQGQIGVGGTRAAAALAGRQVASIFEYSASLDRGRL